MMRASIVALSIAWAFIQPCLVAASISDAIAHASIVGRDVELLSTYDYVIVGAGPAGLTVADRLTENPGINVLVIEAGELDQGEDQILVPFLALQAAEKYWWNITSIPLPGLNNRTQIVRSGKLVGGSTAVNAMMVTRGCKADYDIWEDLGNPGWGWDGLLPYFIKSETFTPPSPEMAAEFEVTHDMSYHGTNGPFQASYPLFLYPVVKVFLHAIREMGSQLPIDFGSGALGGYWIPTTLDPANMTRSYARTAHHDTIQGRPNLHLLPGNKVTQIIFGDKTAKGVKFSKVRGEAAQSAFASREVIIAAGAHRTPQLLQLSGVGPKGLLKSLGISVVSDLPGVGTNFQDHARFNTLESVAHDLNPSPVNTTNTTWLAEQLEVYQTRREGIYTSGRTNSVAFLPLNEISPISDDIVRNLKSQNPRDVFPEGTDPSVIAGWKVERDLLVKYTKQGKLAAAEFIAGLLTGTALVIAKPFSRGFITINSTDAFDHPVVDFGTLRNPIDLDIVVEMIKAWRKMLLTPSFQTMGPTAVFPPNNVTSDAELKTLVRANLLSSVFHPSGTTPMMKKEWGGVVGSDLLVYGTQKLSVIDASIIPVLPGSHTTSVVYAIGEKAADIIKARNL